MPVMTPADLMKFLDDHFPQAADQGLAIEHLDDTTIRVRLPADERHLRPGGTISGPTLMWLADLGFYLLLLGRLVRWRRPSRPTSTSISCASPSPPT